jgi:hypothetical protein
VNESSWDRGAGASYIWEGPMMSGPAVPLDAACGAAEIDGLAVYPWADA